MILRKIKHVVGNVFRFLMIARYRATGVKIGHKCFISMGAWLDERRGTIILQDKVSITRDAKILSHDATASRLRPGEKGEYITTLKKNCFIGMGAIILPGITVGEDSIVGAGSIVTKDVPDGCLVAGNPALIIKRFDKQTGKWNAVQPLK